MTIKYIVIDNNARTVFLLAGVSPSEPPIPPGSGIMTYLHFTVHDTGMAVVDTGLTVIPDIFYFGDNHSQQFLPRFFSSDFHIIPQSVLPGDANTDGHATISDVVWLISYLFKGGPSPSYLPSGDVNTDGNISISDVIYYINNFTRGDLPWGWGALIENPV